jgi:hypothetical protein
MQDMFNFGTILYSLAELREFPNSEESNEISTQPSSDSIIFTKISEVPIKKIIQSLLSKV